MMRIARHLAFIGATSAFICVPGAAQAQLYKCQQDGRTVYQQEKCPDAAKQSTVREPDALAPKPVDPKATAEKAVRDTQVDIDAVIDVMTGFTVCSESVADFGSRYGPAFTDWRARNAAAFGRFNADAEAPRKLEQRLRAARAKPPGDDADARAARAALCARMISTIQPGRDAK